METYNKENERKIKKRRNSVFLFFVLFLFCLYYNPQNKGSYGIKIGKTDDRGSIRIYNAVVGSDNRLGNIKGDKMTEVFAKTIDKFGDQQIDSWTFDTENEARDFTKQKTRTARIAK